MGASIITGYTGTRHITPEMDGAVYRGIIGDDSYILAEGDQCEGSMPSVNQFTVKSGVVSVQGRQVYISQETLAIDTCPTGYKRIDLVCARFEHDTTSLIDQATLIVIKGAEVSGGNDPVEPAHNEGVIKDGATVVDFVMYRLDLDGANVEITKAATVQSSLYTSKETQEKWNEITENGANLDQITGYLADKVALIGKSLTMSNTSWSSGNCTITNSSKYICFLAWAGGAPMFVCFDESGSNVYGYCIASTTTNSQYTRTFSASVSGDTWTMSNHLNMGHNSGGSHASATATTLNWIIGLIPKQ